ncbi:choice-of-anchor J domain-containing protein [uncultured Phocaeicola sp.]|uniref:choice-of-anchor J domain-containing protein n=1 Tax=uncultured Phocaeicola sp. TaxID=990718 RepID=UPI0015A8C36F|nr:choice-of-anchor J domain-containing protein [uncultured Phocaeicola sp.]
MKRILFISTALLASLTACDDYNDQFNLGSQISDVKKGVAIQLAAADYATIANNATNQEIALSKDPENGTYVAALEAIGKNRYFASKTEAEWFLPAFITEKYPQADAGSRFSVSYNMYKEPSAYLADFKNLKEYTLSNADYRNVWGETASATYLSPSTLKKLPEVLADKMENPAEGDMVAVNYAYSEFEPGAGGGSVIPMVYQKVSSFDGEEGNYVIAAKADDGNYYPFGKLDKESYGYGYMNPSAITVGENDVIANADGAEQVVTLGKGENGFTLLNGWSQYVYMSGTYNSFNVSESVPTEGGEWTLSSNGDGTFALKNVEKNKTVKLTYVNGKYSYGCYPESSYAYFSDPMAAETGKFTVTDVTLPAGSTYVWKIDSYGYYKGSAFVGGKNLASESYVISAEIDLSEATAPVLSFNLALNYLNGNTASDFFQVKVASDYAGNLAAATWTDVTYDASGIGSSWNFSDQRIDLSAFNGKKIVVAFVYKSTDQCAPTVELKNALVQEKDAKYWDVCLFKEVAESEVAAAMLRMSRASGAYANSSALYVYSNGAWAEYSKEDVNVLVADPKFYAEIGTDYVSKPSVIFPVYLTQKFPYAVKGEQVAVVYKKTADSNPIVEEYTLNGTWAASTNYATRTTIFEKTADGSYTAQAGVYLDEALTGGDDGGFTIQDIALTGVSYVWKSDASYGWKASAFMNNTNYETESWLLTPAIDLSEAVSPQLSFEEAHKFLNGNSLSEYMMVKVSTDYVDNVETCTWETLEVDETQWSDGQSWDFYKVGPYSLSSYVGQVIRIAFVYKSTSSAAPTWEIKNALVNEAE